MTYVVCPAGDALYSYDQSQSGARMYYFRITHELPNEKNVEHGCSSQVQECVMTT